MKVDEPPPTATSSVVAVEPAPLSGEDKIKNPEILAKPAEVGDEGIEMKMTDVEASIVLNTSSVAVTVQKATGEDQIKILEILEKDEDGDDKNTDPKGAVADAETQVITVVDKPAEEDESKIIKEVPKIEAMDTESPVGEGAAEEDQFKIVEVITNPSLYRHPLNTSQIRTTNDVSKAGRKFLQCRFCEFSYFTQIGLLQSHINKCHPNSEEGITEVPKNDVVKCSQCAKTFARMYSLRKHEQRVHGAQVFSCDKCQKNFSTNSLLQIHIKRHDGPSFKCPICKRFLFQKKSLRHHVNMHYEKDAITPHPICEVCNKEMNTPTEVVSHIETHKNIVYRNSQSK